METAFLRLVVIKSGKQQSVPDGGRIDLAETGRRYQTEYKEISDSNDTKSNIRNKYNLWPSGNL
jgi:hypothetical protein